MRFETCARMNFAVATAMMSICVFELNARAEIGTTDKPAVSAESLPPKKLPEIDAPDTKAVNTEEPLTARITFSIDDIVEREKLPVSLSPIMIDATRQNKLTLEQVLSIAVRRNLPYLQTKWLGHQYFGTFLGSVASLNPFYVSQTVQNVGLATRPDPQKGQVFIQSQPIDRLRYGTSGVTISSGGQTLIPLVANLFQWRARAAAVKTSMQDALFDATNNYFNLCKQISLLHVANIAVQNAKGIMELNDGLLESGMGTRLQLLQAKTQLASYRQELVSQQASARVAAINLGVTLDLPLSDYILPEARPLDKTTLVDPLLPPETLVAIALKSRPEIVQKRNVVRQQFAQSAQALTPLLPTASYSVQRGTFFPSTGGSESAGIERSLQLAWQINSLAVPVVPNFAAGLSAARAAQYDLRNTELQVRSQVRTAYDNSLAAETNIAIAREAARDAQEQLKLAEERLQAGIGINIDVIQAQSALTTALQSYVSAIYQYNTEQAKLRRALGGFTYKSVTARLRYN